MFVVVVVVVVGNVKELVKRDWPVEAQQTSGDLNSALVNMTQHIALLEEKISTLVNTTIISRPSVKKRSNCHQQRHE